jgi:hypothetical protein
MIKLLHILYDLYDKITTQFRRGRYATTELSLLVLSEQAQAHRTHVERRLVYHLMRARPNVVSSDRMGRPGTAV